MLKSLVDTVELGIFAFFFFEADLRLSQDLVKVHDLALRSFDVVDDLVIVLPEVLDLKRHLFDFRYECYFILKDFLLFRLEVEK